MDDLRKLYRTAVIVGLALMASLFIYAGVVEFVPRDSIMQSGPALTKDQLMVMKAVFVGLSVLLYFGSALVRDRMAPAVPPDQRAPSAAEVSARGQRLLTATIVSFALCEIPAPAGLVLFFVSGDALDFYLFMVISLFLFSRSFPRYKDWETRLGIRQAGPRRTS